MDSTFERRHGAKAAFRAAWHHLKELFSASSPSAAWRSFTKMVDALPIWTLVLIIVLAVALFVDRSLVLIPLAIGGFLSAVYFTVKHAARAALEERDREN